MQSVIETTSKELDYHKEMATVTQDKLDSKLQLIEKLKGNLKDLVQENNHFKEQIQASLSKEMENSLRSELATLKHQNLMD